MIGVWSKVLFSEKGESMHFLSSIKCHISNKKVKLLFFSFNYLKIHSQKGENKKGGSSYVVLDVFKKYIRFVVSFYLQIF
jgi:hypothetical protein